MFDRQHIGMIKVADTNKSKSFEDEDESFMSF